MILDHLDENAIKEQALAAGFSTAEQYIQKLVQQNAERLAIQAAFDDYKAGQHRPFAEFDQEFRQRNGLAPRS